MFIDISIKLQNFSQRSCKAKRKKNVMRIITTKIRILFEICKV